MSRFQSFAALFSGLAMMVVSHSAFAQDVTYYTHTDVASCNNVGANAAAGAAVGALSGFLLGGGRASSTIAGAAAGSLFGAAMSCSDRTYYMSNVDYALQRADYWHPYESNNCRVVVLASGLGANGEVCRRYHSEYLQPDGSWMSNETTSCWVEGVWRHGFDTAYIQDIRYTNPAPPIRIVFTPPVFAFHATIGIGFDHAYRGPAPVVVGAGWRGAGPGWRDERGVRREDRVINRNDRVINRDDRALNRDDRTINRDDRVINRDDHVIERQDGAGPGSHVSH